MLKISLIVTIVRKGWGSTVLEASVNAGARGGTVVAAHLVRNDCRDRKIDAHVITMR